MTATHSHPALIVAIFLSHRVNQLPLHWTFNLVDPLSLFLSKPKFRRIIAKKCTITVIELKYCWPLSCCQWAIISHSIPACFVTTITIHYYSLLWIIIYRDGCCQVCIHLFNNHRHRFAISHQITSNQPSPNISDPIHQPSNNDQLSTNHHSTINYHNSPILELPISVKINQTQPVVALMAQSGWDILPAVAAARAHG